MSVGGADQGLSPLRNWMTSPSRASSTQVGSSSGKLARTSNPTSWYHSVVAVTSSALRMTATSGSSTARR